MDKVAFVGWHEGSAGQIHSWFEAAGLGKVALFVHPEPTLPAIEKIPRAVSQFSYPEDGTFKGLPLLAADDWTSHLKRLGINHVLVTISDGFTRWREIQKAQAAGLNLISAVHPTATLLPDCKLGINAIVHSGCIVGYRAELDEGVILNTRTQVDHHCRIGRGSTLDPGVVLAGNVQVEDFCTIHTGAVVINRIKISTGAIVGAGSVVVRNVESHTMVLGVPSRFHKTIT